MAWAWFKAKKPAAVERRAATAEELRTLVALAGKRTYRRAAVSLLLAIFAAVIGGAIAAGSTRNASNMTAMGVAYGLFAAAGVMFIVLIGLVVLASKHAAKSAKIHKVADTMLSPVVPITEGDRLGNGVMGWVVIDADTDRLHVARAQSLAAFKLNRFGALVGAIAVTGGIVAAGIAIVTAPKPKYTIAKVLFFALGGVWWLGRFALTRSAYQWTIEEGDGGGADRRIVMQDAALFGPSNLLIVTPDEIANFAATPREIVVVLKDGRTRPLGGLGGGPLSQWRAACVASTVAGMLDIRVPLVATDEHKAVTSMTVPGTLADDIDLSPSTHKTA